MVVDQVRWLYLPLEFEYLIVLTDPLACGNCLKKPTLRAKCVYASSTSEGPADSSPVRDANGGASLEKALPGSGVGRGRGPVQQQKQAVLQPRVLADSAPHEQSLNSTTRTLSDPPKHWSSHEHFGSGSSSTFAGQVKAAVDARSGGANQAQSPTATPMVDVSLFPSVQAVADLDGLAGETVCELPPRKQADSFVHAYWSQVNPMLPVLSRPQFMCSYSALFSGTAVGTNERIFLSTVNAVFALAVQSQESLDLNTRERLSGRYFGRAHGLLHLPIWETGSIELIQCLLIMSQYLQCTNKPHQTWMVAGAAVRLAQGLGLHSPELWSAPPQDDAAALKCRVWRACIIMDRYEDHHYTAVLEETNPRIRMICLSQGRPALVSENLVSTVVRMQQDLNSRQSKGCQLPFDDCVASTLEVCEIIHHAAQSCFSPPPTQSSNVVCSHILDPDPTEVTLALILQADGCLRRWNNSLPAHLKYESSMHLQNEDSTRQGTILHLR